MAEKRGITETVEMLNWAKDLTVKLIQIRKQGVAGLPILASLYGETVTAIKGADQIPAELKDLDSEEIKTLAKQQVINGAEIFEALDVKTAGPILMLAAESIDAAEQTYNIWTPIVAKAQALRQQPQA